MRRPLVAALAGLALAASGATACARDLPAAAVTCDDLTAMALMAQAVPEAQTIPCFPSLPFGYRATTFDVESGDVELGLSHAVVGLDAVLMTIAADCRVDAEEEVVAPTPPAGERITSAESTGRGGVRGRWVEGLGGACLVVTFDLDHPAGERALMDLDGAWELMSRADLADRLAAETGGRLRLDEHHEAEED